MIDLLIIIVLLNLVRCIDCIGLGVQSKGDHRIFKMKRILFERLILNPGEVMSLSCISTHRACSLISSLNHAITCFMYFSSCCQMRTVIPRRHLVTTSRACDYVIEIASRRTSELSMKHIDCLILVAGIEVRLISFLLQYLF